MYYSDKIESLQRMFGGRRIVLEEHALLVDEVRYPIVDDVIILLDPSQYTPKVREKLAARGEREANSGRYAEDIQFSFGHEWETYDTIQPEDRQIWGQYFDFVNPLEKLAGATVVDLGCGIGRWSYFLKDIARELTLVDFSDAVFVARRNLAEVKHALFFMCNIKELPFADKAFDLVFSLGVLHHLPSNCIQEVRNVSRMAAKYVLIYLYYALDNRPFYFRMLVVPINWSRAVLSRVRSPAFRKVFCVFGTWFIYLPLIWLGKFMDLFGLGKYVPIYHGHSHLGLERIEQGVYDRFFTRIEQRASRKDIRTLGDIFPRITICDTPPFWTFFCERHAAGA